MKPLVTGGQIDSTGAAVNVYDRRMLAPLLAAAVPVRSGLYERYVAMHRAFLHLARALIRFGCT